MNAWKLPTTVTVCGQEFAIRSDFRAVLDALAPFGLDQVAWEGHGRDADEQAT